MARNSAVRACQIAHKQEKKRQKRERIKRGRCTAEAKAPSRKLSEKHDPGKAATLTLMGLGLSQPDADNYVCRAIAKICARIVTTDTENGMIFDTEYGELTEERVQKIYTGIEDAISYGYDLRSVKQRYFFETDFKKITPRPPMGTRIFDLTQVLNTDTLPETSKIAEMLKQRMGVRLLAEPTYTNSV